MTDAAKGGPGSGNFNHAGRPGLVGGSAPRGASRPAGVPAVPHGDQFLPGDVDRPTYDDRLAQLDTHERDEKATDLLNQGLDDLCRELNVPRSLGLWNAATEEMRQIVKGQITDRLAQATAIDEADVRAFINQWAISSNDHDMGSLALQQDAADFFGVPISEWQQGRIAELQAQQAQELKQPVGGLGLPLGTSTRLLPSERQQVLLWRMYDDTQRALVKTGYNRETGVVRLYRGVRFSADRPEAKLREGDKADYHGSTLESWSVDWGAALGFAHPKSSKSEVGLVLAMDVPVRNILSTARTGFGCLSEGEFVILGSVPGSRVRVHDRPPW